MDSTRSHKLMIAFLTVLLIGNFLLDVLRRFDFEHEAETLRANEARLRDTAEQTQIATAGLDTGIGELTQALAGFEDSLVIIDRSIQSLADLAAASAEAARLASEREPEAAAPAEAAESALERVLVADAEELRQRMKEGQRDPNVRMLLTRIRDRGAHETADIVRYAEGLYGLELDERERRLLEARVETWRIAGATTLSRYILGLRQSMQTRLEEGDYETASSVPPDERPAEADDGKRAIATYLIGDKHFGWSREDYPELDRQDLLHQAVSVVAAEEIREFFAERSSR